MTATAHRLELPRWDQPDWRGRRQIWDVLHANQRSTFHSNPRVHNAIRQRSVNFVLTTVANLARAAAIPQSEHLTVELVWVPDRRNRNRDSDNLWPLLKVCADALARGPARRARGAIGLDLVPDDDAHWMTKLAPRIGDHAAETPGLRLLVIAHTRQPEPATTVRLLHELATTVPAGETR
ncbi:hypothetical protein Psed_5763 [Pseudonocardia dioxanivorans CB1190]|uniref:Uncharacterized protein n=1 Tax=Pseudonocardia dioxanivorans (strain ATCC 55486 / DSM 44775 / JCM 13855 / CB1190) TaxID=675635 RepID=F4D1A2_PSEUX|nr:hypothetical protein [Pseudonocardia dioxanivorans]AEA27890.1 hypothetical protein Psed_5763 [Pseudonocardia dioxanivorans CB1190]